MTIEAGGIVCVLAVLEASLKTTATEDSQLAEEQVGPMTIIPRCELTWNFVLLQRIARYLDSLLEPCNVNLTLPVLSFIVAYVGVGESARSPSFLASWPSDVRLFAEVLRASELATWLSRQLYLGRQVPSFIMQASLKNEHVRLSTA